MNLDALLAKYPSGTVLNDYGGQCVSLAAHYCLDNGKPIAYADAKDWWNHPALTGAFTFVRNNPSDLKQIPPRGAVMIWDGALPGSGGAGHIAVFVKVVSPGIFQSYDNNWGGRYCHFVNHNWNNIIGWMIPKAAAPAPAPTPQGGDEVFKTDAEIQEFYNMLRGQNATAPEVAGWRGGSMLQFVLRAKPEVANREAAKKAQAQHLADQQALINQLNQTITGITSQSNTTKAQKDAALIKVAELTAELETATDKLKDAQAHQGGFTDADRQTLNQTSGWVKVIFDYFAGQYKTFQKYIKKEK